MNKYINFNGKEVAIPTSLGEVTWGMYKRVSDASQGLGLSDIQFIAAITDLSVEDWRDYEDVSGYLNLMLQVYPIYGQIINHLSSDIKTSSIKNLEWKPVGQWQDCSKIAKNLYAIIQEYNNKPLEEKKKSGIPDRVYIEAYERFYKIYHHPKETGESYSDKKAMAWNIDNKPFVEVVNFSRFFFQNWTGLQVGIIANAEKSPKPRKSLWRRLMRSA